MEETLKAIRLLHQVITGVAATLLAFATAPDESKNIQKALDELYTIQGLNFAEYATWVAEKLTENPDSHTTNDFPARLADSLGVSLYTEIKYAPAFFVEWPSATASLYEWDYFLRLATVESLEPEIPLRGLPAMDGISLPERVSVSLESVSVHLAREDSLTVMSAFVRGRVAKKASLEREGVVSLLFRPHGAIGDGESSLYEHHAKLVLGESYRWSYPSEWIQTLPSVCARIFNNPPQHVDVIRLARKSNIYSPSIPTVRRFWRELGHLPIQHAIEKLEKRTESSSKELTLFFVSLDRTLLLWAGPLIMVLMVAYLKAHLAHLESLARERIDEARMFPWIGLFAGKLSAALVFLTLFLLPVAAVELLIWRTGAGGSRILGIGIAGAALLVVQLQAAQSLIRIRNALRRVVHDS